MAEPRRGKGAAGNGSPGGSGAGRGPARKGTTGATPRREAPAPTRRTPRRDDDASARAAAAGAGDVLHGEYADPDSVDVFPTAQRIAAIAQDKLADGVVILDMREFCSFTDAFIVASGRNPRQVRAIVDEILEKMRQERRLLARSVAGERDADWVVVDYVDVVVHVFTPEQRAYYRLEELWSDVPRVELDASDAA